VRLEGLGKSKKFIHLIGSQTRDYYVTCGFHFVTIIFCRARSSAYTQHPSPQLGESGLRIYVPQRQDDPVIPPGSGFPFLLLLRLAGLQWRYSDPPPHGCNLACNLPKNYCSFFWETLETIKCAVLVNCRAARNYCLVPVSASV
jgi:hypothetical protein